MCMFSQPQSFKMEHIECAFCVQDSYCLRALNSKLVGEQDSTLLHDRCRTVMMLKSEVYSRKFVCHCVLSVEFELYYIHVLLVTRKTRASITSNSGR